MTHRETTAQEFLRLIETSEGKPVINSLFDCLRERTAEDASIDSGSKRPLPPRKQLDFIASLTIWEKMYVCQPPVIGFVPEKVPRGRVKKHRLRSDLRYSECHSLAGLQKYLARGNLIKDSAEGIKVADYIRFVRCSSAECGGTQGGHHEWCLIGELQALLEAHKPT